MADQVNLRAEDISCEHCARAIRRALGEVEGVEVVDVNVAAKTITLRYASRAVLEKAKAVLDDIGYPATEVG